MKMVKRMLDPPGISPKRLAAEVGVSATQLSVWRQAARKVAQMSSEKPSDKPPPPATSRGGGGDRMWSAGEKLRLLAASADLNGEQLGAFLRQEGLHEEVLKEWRAAATGALSNARPEALTFSQRHRLAAAEKELKELKRELRRKEKALAEAAALLILEKKLQALGWDERQSQGEEDDAPDEEREK